MLLQSRGGTEAALVRPCSDQGQLPVGAPSTYSLTLKRIFKSDFWIWHVSGLCAGTESLVFLLTSLVSAAEGSSLPLEIGSVVSQIGQQKVSALISLCLPKSRMIPSFPMQNASSIV